MDTDSQPKRPSFRIGRYELFRPSRMIDPTGGTPWTGRDASLHRRVWVFPVPRESLDEEERQRLGVSTTIRDSTVISVLDVRTVSAQDPSAANLVQRDLPVPGVYLVLEHVDAKPLELWMDATTMSGTRVRQLLLDVATALHEAHTHGVVHGRLTADYVIVDKAGCAHVWLFEPERSLLAPDTVGSAKPEDDILDFMELGRALVGRLGFTSRAGVRDLVGLFEERPGEKLPTLDVLLDRLAPPSASHSAKFVRAASSGAHPSRPPITPDPGGGEIGDMFRSTPSGGIGDSDSASPPSGGPKSEADIEADALARLKAKLFTGAAKARAEAEPEPEPEPEPAPENKNRFVGRYELLRRLGRGGAGVVYLAQDTTFGRQVALKIIALPLNDPEAETELRRLEREARALARIRHPNVVKVYESGTYQDERVVADGRNRGAYLALEFVDGESLYEWSTRKHDWREVVAVYIQVARGLSAAHQNGLVHRDFKPSNALLGSDGTVRVVDFGLASGEPADFNQSFSTMPGVEETRAVWGDRLTGTGLVVGTPAYMAPERYGGTEADELSDQFSYFVALFESLYGDWPFAGQSAKELRREIQEGTIQWREEGDVPESVRRIVARGLATKAGERFPDMLAVERALEAELDRDARKKATRRRLIVGAIVVAVAAAAGTAVVMM